MGYNRFIVGWFAGLVALSAAISSCKKVDDLINPKSGDAKLEDLMTSGTWRIDTLHSYLEEQGRISRDTVRLNAGTLQCFTRKAAGNPGYGGGWMLYNHADTAGHAVTDSLVWYPGTWGSSDIDGSKLTFFYTDKNHKGMDGAPCTFTFIERGDNRIIIDGIRATQDLSNGIIDRYHWHYCLSKQ